MDIDTTKPNGGRIYDYYLGGNHNFEVDRTTAEQLSKILPSIKAGALLNRWFMHDAVQRLVDARFDCYLDLATGLPTEGYIHDLAPDARILYNDIDPVTIAYGRSIVGETSNIQFVQSNIADIDAILAAADAHFGGQRRIAISFIGASYFIDTETLRGVLDALYAWCAPGSQIAMSWLIGDVNGFAQSQVAAIYRQMRSPVYGLSMAAAQEMLARWDLLSPGLIELNRWNGVDDEWRTPSETGLEKEPLDLYGMIAVRP
ncbi:SAM-dependent methyltransferase [Oscillochloris sp. ZM17-4]|uniref:SAM-dependent methyltransferase n=1 Tax=Oscillochloris sp. ZM17-4 TaxID=2866714 RepID=UPI001C739836|nr:SAM-dependent methyltransferase [Oscillochloris sp. ZM17-4]MBX0330586.1 SAM-dependent methyltransferase [Oscillochloris sp. ZM17-4]